MKEYYVEFTRENIWHWEYFSSVDGDSYLALQKEWRSMLPYGGYRSWDYLKVLLF